MDDDQSVRRTLSRLIRSVNFEVETFRTARAFLDHPLPDRPACLVLDVQLPGLSGLDLQTELAWARKDIPIIFITGYGDVPMSVRAMKRGAVNFLEKPSNDQELLDCIQRALTLSRAQRADRADTSELDRRLARLTPRERDVLLGVVVAGKSSKQIDNELAIAVKTTKVHRGRLMTKMQARSLADLVRMTQNLASLLR